MSTEHFLFVTLQRLAKKEITSEREELGTERDRRER